MNGIGASLGDPVPDANTTWTFREALTKAGATAWLLELFDQQLRAAGYLAMPGQLVDASIVAAAKQRDGRAEKRAIKEGRIPEGWQDKPAKLRRKDPDARWTVTSNAPRPSCKRTAANPGPTSRSRRPSAIRPTPAPTGGIA